MPLVTHDELRLWRIVTELQSGGGVSQRALARKLDVALGLTNKLIRELVERRFVRVTGSRRTGISYQVTAAGQKYQARISRAHMDQAVRAFGEVRTRVERRLSELSASWRSVPSEKRVVVYDDGVLGEIACLYGKSSGLQIVGVVGSAPGAAVGDLTVRPEEELSGNQLGETPFERLIVMSFRPPRDITRRLKARGVHPASLYWI